MATNPLLSFSPLPPHPSLLQTCIFPEETDDNIEKEGKRSFPAQCGKNRTENRPFSLKIDTKRRISTEIRCKSDEITTPRTASSSFITQKYSENAQFPTSKAQFSMKFDAEISVKHRFTPEKQCLYEELTEEEVAAAQKNIKGLKELSERLDVQLEVISLRDSLRPKTAQISLSIPVSSKLMQRRANTVQF